MGMVLMPTLLISFVAGYVFRDSGISVPDLGAFLADNKAKSAHTLALENYAIWASVFSLAHFVLYVEPQRSFFHPFKLNPNYPPTSLILKEIGRSVRGEVTLICCSLTAFASLMNFLYIQASPSAHFMQLWSTIYMVPVICPQTCRQVSSSTMTAQCQLQYFS